MRRVPPRGAVRAAGSTTSTMRSLRTPPGPAVLPGPVGKPSFSSRVNGGACANRPHRPALSTGGGRLPACRRQEPASGHRRAASGRRLPSAYTVSRVDADSRPREPDALVPARCGDHPALVVVPQGSPICPARRGDMPAGPLVRLSASASWFGPRLALAAVAVHDAGDDVPKNLPDRDSDTEGASAGECWAPWA